MRSFIKMYVWLTVFSFVSVFCSVNLQAQQQGLVKMDEQTLVVDLTEITSLSARSEVYDFLKSNSEFRISPLHSAAQLAISSSKMTKTEMLQYYQESVQRIIQKDLIASKGEQTNLLQSFASKYGYDTSDKLMRGVLETENDSCHNSLPFCTDLIYNFPAGVNSGYAEIGPNYNCLITSPNPAWYHMKVAIAGSLTIKIFSTPAKDIDFCLWGPFDDPTSICATGLPMNKVIDCSYDPGGAPEYCVIPNGIVGKYYILLLCNFSNNPCNITFQKTAGTGATDCTIVPPPIGSNSPVCEGETINLWADDFAGATYAWSGPGGWTSNQQNPTILNATMSHTGTYSLIITVNGSQSQPISTGVVVNATPIPAFTGENVCFDATTHFTNQSYTIPPNLITSRLWNFGDGQTSTELSPTHVYATSGSFNVTLTCYTGMLNCAETVQHTVLVYPNAVPEFSASTACFNEDTEFTNLSDTDPPGELITAYFWDFGDGQTSTEPSPTHKYANTGAYNVTLTCYTGTNDCDQFVNHEVVVNAVPVPAFTADNVCYGETTGFLNQSVTDPPGQPITGYYWDFDDGNTSTQPSPTHTYVNPGNYTVTLTCYTGNQNCERSTSHISKVFVKPYVDAGEDNSISYGWYDTLVGSISEGSGSYSYLWAPEDKVEESTQLTTLTKSLTQTQVFTLTATDLVTGCISSGEVIITINGGPLGVIASASSGEICLGNSIGLLALASGGSDNKTYSWTSSDGSLLPSFPEITVIPETAGTFIYTVVVSDGQVTVSDDVTVIVKPVPSANAGVDKSINVGTSTTLHGSSPGWTGGGVLTYLWNPADSLANPGISEHQLEPNTKILYDTINQTHFYFQVSSDNGCVSISDEAVITVGGELLSVGVSATKVVICKGETDTITAAPFGGGSNYSYAWTSNPVGFSSSERVIVVQPSVNTVYSVNVTDEFNLHATNSIPIIVNPLPLVILPNLTYNDTVSIVKACVRDTVELDAGPNMEYLWNNGSTNRKITTSTNGLFVDLKTFSVLVTNPVS
ncbi:MAG: PKD domain-containing protein, partial [Bacteroidales bacterium]